MLRRLRIALLLTPLLLAGCLSSTPPSNYYLLTANTGAAPTGDTPAIGVGPIRVPEYVNRSGIVYLREGNKLQIAQFDRWAEPLLDGVQRVMSIGLASELDTQSIQAFPWPRSRTPDFAVKISILALDASQQEARLVAEWIVSEPGSGAIVERRMSRLQTPLNGDFSPALIPPAYSNLLQQLAAEIATAIRRAHTG